MPPRNETLRDTLRFLLADFHLLQIFHIYCSRLVQLNDPILLYPIKLSLNPYREAKDT